MSQSPSNRRRIYEVAPSSRRNLFHSSDSPTPSSMDVDSSSDSYRDMAGTRWAAKILTDLLLLNLILSSDLLSSMTPMPARTTIAIASTESHGISPLIAVPASISTVARQSGIPGPETPTVGNDVASVNVFANHVTEHPGSDAALLT